MPKAENANRHGNSYYPSDNLLYVCVVFHCLCGAAQGDDSQFIFGHQSNLLSTCQVTPVDTAATIGPSAMRALEAAKGEACFDRS